MNDELRTAITRKVFMDVDFHVPEIWLSLHTSEPGLGGAAEIAVEGYQRQRAYFKDGVAPVLAENRNDVDYAPLPELTVTHVGCWTKKQGGDFIRGAPLRAPAQNPGGDLFRVPAGALQIL